MNVAVVGSGRVGLVAGACFADFGLQVLCVDSDETKIRALREGRPWFFEPGLQELVQKNLAAGRLKFTTSLSEAVQSSLVLFIAVGTDEVTPGKPNLNALYEVTRAIGREMREYRVLVVKSTVPVGTAEALANVLREQTRVPFDVVSNPEFLREGSAIENFVRPDRVVLGGTSEQALAILRDVYRPLYLIEAPILCTDNATAEMVKYATNAFLSLKITFINEMANLCDVVGADVHTIAKGIGLDKRIGPKFLHPGPGFGGSCLPKDTRTLAALGKQFHSPLPTIEGMLQTNHSLCDYLVDRLKEFLGGQLEGRSVAVLGLSYKPNTDDVRESPALLFIRALLRHGVSVQAHDPMANGEARRVLGESTVSFHPDPISAATAADAVAILTEWNEFRSLNLEALRAAMRGNVMLDTRNIYEPETAVAKGFVYLARGRSRGRAIPQPELEKAAAAAD